MARQDFSCRSPEKGRDAECKYSTEIGTIKINRQAMLPECLINCQRKSSMENYKLENAPMVVRRSDARTHSKPPLKTSTYQQSHGNRLHRIEKNGKASQEGLLARMKQKEPTKLSRNVLSRKPELRHQQSFLPETSLVLSATGSLEIRFVSSAILQYIKNNTSCI